MSSRDRFLVVALVLAIAGYFSLRQPVGVLAQKAPTSEPQEPTVEEDREFTDAITLPPSRKAQLMLEAAQDLIQEKNWTDAIYVLQQLLEIKEDAFIRTKRNSTERISVRIHANRLMGSLPKEAKEVYETLHGERARQMLTQAKENGDINLLALVEQRFRYTSSGSEAAKLLATYYLDRGQPVRAALQFERLLQRQDVEIEPLTLLKASIAFRWVGKEDLARTTWERLARVSPNGLKLSGRNLSLADLEKAVAALPKGVETFSTRGISLFRGNSHRNAIGDGDIPYLDEIAWKQPMLPPYNSEVNKHISLAIAKQEQKQLPVLPAFFPVVAENVDFPGDDDPEPTSLLIYRNHSGIQALNMKDGKLAWEQVSDLSLDRLSRSGRSTERMPLTQWLPNFVNNQSHNVLIENSLLGTLSSDDRMVYAIDDLAIPPHPVWLRSHANWRNKPQKEIYGKLTDAIHHNRLQAIEIRTGKAKWELGGMDERAGEFAESFFLGPPLPLAGKLYILNEKRNGELRLICLQPPTKEFGEPKVEWMQTLAHMREPLLESPARRLHAVHLAYRDGILVCPTNAGAVLGVDLLTHSLVWAHSYRERAAAAGDETDQLKRLRIQYAVNTYPVSWKNCAPVIQGDKVFVTAPDAESLHCLNLHDGRLLWKANRGDDLYLAGVFDDKVVLVGRHVCRALDANNGKLVWSVETGLPSGQGVATGGLYFLPLKSSPRSNQTEVCAIDLASGHIVARARRRSGDGITPGNLLFHNGVLVSQSLAEVAAFPQLGHKLAQLDRRLQQNPKDIATLSLRAELRVDQGDLRGAVEDLHAVLAVKPPAEVVADVRRKLFDTLTELLRRDFDSGQAFLREYEELCRVEVPADAPPSERQRANQEQQRRQSRFYSLLAKGREKQGRLVEALNAYLEFARFAANMDLITMLDDPAVKVRPDIWAKGRIDRMLKRANAAQRAALEKEIDKHWRSVAETSDVEKLRSFVALFGGTSGRLAGVGSAARMRLAQVLIDLGKELDAELQLLHLTQQDDDRTAARALEMLAELNTRRGLLEDAAFYYRQIAERFPTVPLRPGVTGADLINELATDKRFLPYLDMQANDWENRRVKVRNSTGNFRYRNVFAFRILGECVPSVRRYQIMLDLGNYRLDFRNPQSDQDNWTHSIPRIAFSYSTGTPMSAIFPCYCLGHTCVLQVGHMLYAFDLASQRLLWQRQTTASNPTRLLFDNFGRMRAQFADGHYEFWTHAGLFQAGLLSFQAQNKLLAVDPYTGQLLWERNGVPALAHLFGDADLLFYASLSADGGIGSVRAVRAEDGIAVDLPDSSHLLTGNYRILGNQILVEETDRDSGKRRVRLYDLRLSDDVWSRELPPAVKIMNADDPYLLGLANPSDGHIEVIDLRKQTSLLDTTIDTVHLKQTIDIHLLEDNEQFYIATNNPVNNAKINGRIYPGLRLGHAIPVNGMIFAFDKKTGKPRWWNEVEHDMLLLHSFRDMPVLLLSARYSRWRIVGRSLETVTTARAFDKVTGKLVLNDRLASATQFTELNVNPATGYTRLVSPVAQYEFFVENMQTEKVSP
ncbi:MAG: hypothetical protein KatS3mg105_1353 [Gemmatales bacterium]|nr:MAG: hypothetical protein KatS3mg105_1353 [Gemmatales bacterium]